MEDNIFGSSLRELRKQAGLSLRALAQKADIDFTYLSKIENGKMSPPSRNIVLRLADALSADKDELLISSGRVPSEMAEVMRDRKTLRFLRKHAGKSARTSNELRWAATPFRKLGRPAIAFGMVAMLSLMLWIAVPAQALSVAMTNPPALIPGSGYSFSVTVNIADNELPPIQSIDLHIYKPGNRANYEATLSSLPLSNDSGSYDPAATGGGAAQVVASAASNWNYWNINGNTDQQGSGYVFYSPPGYGHGYGAGPASITYDVAWEAPPAWPAGEYAIEVRITTNNNTTFTRTGGTFLLAPSKSNTSPAPTPS